MFFKKSQPTPKAPEKKIEDTREPIHFLHIGKNAGTQIAKIGRQINSSSEKYRFIRYGHRAHINRIPKNEKYFFSIRNPVTRFKSSFYSRKRKGQPRIHHEWSKHEKLAFEAFEHANDLAEALFEPTERGSQAYSAMRSISHVAMNQHMWFKHLGFFLETKPPLHIIRQEHFDTDLEALLRKLEFNAPVAITKNNVGAHKNDYSEVPSLSQTAIDKLEIWYSPDIEFYRICENWINSQS